MNWVLIAVLIILAVSAIAGYCKGMLRIVYSMIAWIIVLAFVVWSIPHINLYLRENTLIYEKIETYCEERVRRSANDELEQAGQEKSDELTEQLNENEMLESLGIGVPAPVLEGILEKTTDAAGTLVEQSGIYTDIAEGLADFILKGISFLTALIAAWILVHIISQLLGIVSRIPVIKGANRSLGLLVGTVYGLLLVWLAFYVVALGSAGETGQLIVSYIYESSFLTFLYENNFVLTLILKYF